MKNKTILIFGLPILLVVIGTVLGIFAEDINIIFNQEDKDVLSSVGTGIGSIQKIREVCDNNSENCFNETYIDKLVLQSINSNTFRLYEEGGINKEFEIELERICKGYGKCFDEEMQEEYDCCSEGYRAETTEEKLIKAEKKAKEILNKIIKVTKERQTRINVKEFDDVEIII